MLYKGTHCAGCILANTVPHQLCWGDWEMGNAISCRKCIQVADLIHMVGRSTSKVASLRACKRLPGFIYIGIRAGLASPFLAGPLFWRFNEIHYTKLRANFARACYSRTTSKVFLTPCMCIVGIIL